MEARRARRRVGGARRREGARSVHGAGGVAGALARVVGGSFGAPRFDHGLLAPSSQTKKRKVTSTPEVPGPSRSWSPAPAAPSSPLDLCTRLHRRGYLRRKHRRARLSWAKAQWRRRCLEEVVHAVSCSSGAIDDRRDALLRARGRGAHPHRAEQHDQRSQRSARQALHRSFLPVEFRSPQKGSYRRLLLTDNRGPPGTVLRCATNGARGPYNSEMELKGETVSAYTVGRPSQWS